MFVVFVVIVVIIVVIIVVVVIFVVIFVAVIAAGSYVLIIGSLSVYPCTWRFFPTYYDLMLVHGAF